MSARQGVITKRKATNKNRAKYKVKTQRTASQVARNGKITTKYAYSKKVLVNGKYRYYYS